MACCLLGLGSNLGDRKRTLGEAIGRLERHPQVERVAASRWHETLPVGGPPGQTPFLNGAARVETSLTPEALLDLLQRIETELGRRRDERWGPRTLDLDLLLYDRLVLSTPRLAIPHARMAWRRFVLTPAAEIASVMVHPTIGWTVRQLLDHLDASPWYAALAGTVAVGKGPLARQVAQRCDARRIEDPLGTSSAAGGPNRAGPALEMELEFLERRIRALAVEQPEWRTADRSTISDFWLGQSPAYARLMDPDGRQAFSARWREMVGRAVRPRLIVLMEMPVDVLHARLAAGGSCPTLEQLDRIARSIREEALRPGQGPVLRLGMGELATSAAADEVSAAIEAMR